MTEKPQGLPWLLQGIERQAAAITAGIEVLRAVAASQDEIPHHLVEFVADGLDHRDREMRNLLEQAHKLARVRGEAA